MNVAIVVEPLLNDNYIPAGEFDTSYIVFHLTRRN